MIPATRALVTGVIGLLLAAGASAAAVEPASGPAGKLAPGGITTRAEVERARTEARAAEAAAEAVWRTAQARCLEVFFATACREAARRQYLEARREARRVLTAAGEVERGLDRQARADARAAAQRDAPTAEQVAAREVAARAEFEARQQRAREAADDHRRREIGAEQRRQAQAQRVSDQQQRDALRAAQAAAEADSARRFTQRQAQAQAYAERKAQQRADNERRRAERQREREKKMIEQGRAPPLAGRSGAPGAGDAAAPKVDLPPDIPPPAALADDRPELPRPAPSK